MRFLRTALAACILASLSLPGLAQEDLASLKNRVEELFDKGDYPEAMRVAKQRKEAAERQLGPDHPDTVASLNSIAFLYKAQGQYGEAEPLYKRALAIREKTLGPEHPDTAESLNNIALLCAEQGRVPEAKPLYKRALAIREKMLGPDHPDTAQSLSNLARIYESEGQYAQAEPLYKRALAIYEKTLGPDHPDTALSLNNLALLYEQQGQYAAAEPLFRRALAVRKKTLGPDHPDTAASLYNLETHYKRSLAICEKHLGPDHPDTKLCRENLAKLQNQQADEAAIGGLLVQKSPAEKVPTVVEPQVDLAALNSRVEELYGRGDYAEAMKVAKKLEEAAERQLGPDHPDTAACLNTLAFLCQAQGEYAKAEPLYKRALAVREKTLGPDYPGTALSLNNLALLYKAQGRYAEAEPLLKRALAIKEKALGPDDPSTAASLNNLAELYAEQGQYAQAEPLYKRSLVIKEKSLGPDHPSTATSLSNLAMLYRAQGQYAQAEPLFKRASAINEKSLGPDHPSTATSLNNLAGLYADQGQYAEAEPFYKRALAISEKSLGPGHPDTAQSLNNLAEIYRNQGHYSRAEPLFRRALAITEKTLGPDHPGTAASLSSFAGLYYAQGQYADAEPLYKRALAIREKTLGPDHPDTAQSLGNLAVLYCNIGQYAQAEPLYKRALAINEKSLGPDHPDTSVSLSNLAGLYADQGQYAEAEPLYKRALAIKEKSVGPDHPSTATSLNNLAENYADFGRYAEAEPLLKRALAIKEKAHGPDHPDTALSLNNLAVLYCKLGQYAEAEPLLKRSLAIREKNLGPDHPDTAQSLNNLAEFYAEQGQYAQVEPLYKRALAIHEKSLGPDHPDTAVSLSNLAGLYADQGQYAEAEPLYKRALAIKEKALGPDHPGTALSLSSLGYEQALTGDWLAAVGSIDRARHGIRRHVARVLPSLSDREQIQFLKVRDEANLHSALSIGLAKADDPKIAALSAGWLANAKSVGQEAAAERILIAREGNNPAAKKLADELTAVRRQLAALRQAVTAAAESQDILKKIGEFEEQERSLIRSLGAAVPWVEKDDPWVGIDAIRRSIPAGTVFVDIARFAVFDFAYVAREGMPYDPFRPARYAAWIVPPAGAGDVRVIDLGDATRIDGLVDEVRSLLNAHSEAKGAIATKGEGAAEKELAAATTPLSQLTIQPILRAATAALGAAPKELVISADGKLWLVPFAALPLDDGRYAIEETAIRLVTSGRDLVDPEAAERRSAAVGKPLIMAAPDFDNESAGRAANQKADNRGVSSISRPITARRLPKVAALPGTLDEATAVAPSVGRLADARPDVVTGGDATEARFKATQRPIVAILATHGFFLPDQQIDRKLLASLQGSDGGGRGLADSRGEALENPLTRCGLLFAGCNRANAADATANATEDGVLTGLEIIGCDLRGTKLVVLSACQTGLGDVEAGQGVAGLRQAFQLAGARSVVATLWSVPDRETAELSSGMFANLADGKPTSDSLRQAQIDMIASRRRLLETAHPFFWAAFTVTGK